jgi:hypothetical protein
VVEIVLEATVSGTVAEFNSEAYKAALATSLNITSTEISLEVTAASVRVVATIRPTTRPPTRVVQSVRSLVLQLTTGNASASTNWTQQISASFGEIFLTVSEPVTSLIIVPAPSPPPPEPSPAMPPPLPPPPPPSPPYYLEWLETGYNSLVVVSATTLFYLGMIVVAMYCCTPANKGLKTLSLWKQLEFVFTVALATEDFISDVLYYYVQVSPCMFEKLVLSFECTTFASPVLFYLSTTALFLPICIYALYSGFLRGVLLTLTLLLQKAGKITWKMLMWLWSTDVACWPESMQRKETHRWLKDYSGLNSHVPLDPPIRLLDWLVRWLLLLLLTAAALLTTFGLVPIGLLLWVLAVLVMLFFGVNTKMFALQGYMKVYNRLLFPDASKKRREQQVRDVNFSLLAEVLFESIPQLVIVFVNETRKRDPGVEVARESATSTGPKAAATGTILAFVNETVDDGLRDRVEESLRERVLGFSGLAWFTLVTSMVMIFIELFPFAYRVCKSGGLVRGFYIPVLELDENDVADVKKFRDAGKEGWAKSREVGKGIADRRRQASGRLRVEPGPSASSSEAPTPRPPSPAPAETSNELEMAGGATVVMGVPVLVQGQATAPSLAPVRQSRAHSATTALPRIGVREKS